jgi:hypothetical protein
MNSVSRQVSHQAESFSQAGAGEGTERTGKGAALRGDQRESQSS